MLRIKAFVEQPNLPPKGEIGQFYTRTGGHLDTAFPSKPGVAVVYGATKRYSDAPADTLLVDSYTHSTSGPPVRPFEVFVGGHLDVPRVYKLGTTYSSGITHEAELPRYLQEKMAALYMLASAHTLSYGDFVYCPGVGLKFGSGNCWIEVTWEDLMRTG